jgi:hypothetical protein
MFYVVASRRDGAFKGTFVGLLPVPEADEDLPPVVVLGQPVIMPPEDALPTGLATEGNPDILVVDEGVAGPSMTRAEQIARDFFAAVQCPVGRRVWLARKTPTGRYGLALLTTEPWPPSAGIPGAPMMTVLDFVETPQQLTPRDGATLSDMLPPGARPARSATLFFVRVPGSPEVELLAGSAGLGGHDEPPSVTTQAQELSRKLEEVASLILRPEYVLRSEGKLAPAEPVEASPAIASAERSLRGVVTEALVADLGEHRANLMAAALPALRRQYQAALAKGVRAPVLLTLDLSDRGARAIARHVNPKDDPKKMQARARKQGAKLAMMHVAASPVLLGRAIGNLGTATAQQIQSPPPAGHVWYVIVSQGRTKLLAITPSTFEP